MSVTPALKASLALAIAVLWGATALVDRGAPTFARPSAQTVKLVINATQATHVVSGVSSTIDDAPLRVGRRGGEEYISYVKFELPERMGRDAEIMTATLRLYCLESEMQTMSIPLFQLSPVQDGWPTSYANRPKTTDPRTDWRIDACADGQRWKSISGPNLVSVVQTWYDDAETNHGWEIRLADMLSDIRFAFQQIGRPPAATQPLSNPPQLVVEYREAGLPTPSSTATPAITPTPSRPPTQQTLTPTDSPTAPFVSWLVYLPLLRCDQACIPR